MNISVGGVVEIQLKTVGSEIYCAWSSIIHKGHTKSGVISIKHSRDITN